MDGVSTRSRERETVHRIDCGSNRILATGNNDLDLYHLRKHFVLLESCHFLKSPATSEKQIHFT